MTLHCARCGKTLIDGTIVVAKLLRAEYCEIDETVTPREDVTVIAYYCEKCMLCVH